MKEIIDTPFSIWFRQQMRERDLTVRYITRCTGIHECTIGKHRHGLRCPTKPYLDKYADFFEIPKEDMYKIADFNPAKYKYDEKHELFLTFKQLTVGNKRRIWEQMEKYIEEQKF